MHPKRKGHRAKPKEPSRESPKGLVTKNRFILIPNQKLQFAAVFFAPCFVRRLDNTYSILCAVFLA